MKKIMRLLFVTASLGEIISILFSLDLLHIVSKPLIMITLGIYYLVSVQKENRSRSLILAVVFSFIGDVFLMQNSMGAHFLLGLFAFLISHIFYILTYRQHKLAESEHGLQGMQRIRFAFPVILTGTGLIVVLYPVLGNLKFPVVLYALVLMLMVLNALFRYGHTNVKSFWMVFAGAVLFLASDATLAINKFLQPFGKGVLVIMLTYIAAQYLIVSGLIDHTSKKTDL
jgi:uncharacterized membrane protein YhhN